MWLCVVDHLACVCVNLEVHLCGPVMCLVGIVSLELEAWPLGCQETQQLTVPFSLVRFTSRAEADWVAHLALSLSLRFFSLSSHSSAISEARRDLSRSLLCCKRLSLFSTASIFR